MRQLFSASVLGVVAGVVGAAAPALAGSVVQIPEPASMSLAASAVAAAVVAYRFMRRK